GVCGKPAEVANLQDLLIYSLKGISFYNNKARELKLDTKKADRFIIESLFMTITNANFDKARFVSKIKEALKLRDEIKKSVVKAGGSIEDITHDSASWYSDSEDVFDEKSKYVGILATEN